MIMVDQSITPSFHDSININ